MKKVLAIVVIFVMLFTNISWADMFIVQQTKDTGIKANLDWINKASDSDGAKGTASNTQVLPSVLEKPVIQVLEVDGDSQTIYSGQPINYKLQVGEDIEDNEKVTAIIEDETGKQVYKHSVIAKAFRNLHSISTTKTSLPSGAYKLYAEAVDGTVLSEVTDFTLTRGAICEIEFDAPLVKGLGEPDPLPLAYIRDDNGEKVGVELFSSRLIREQGEDTGEYKITGIEASDYDEVKLISNDQTKLVINGEQYVKDLKVTSNYKNFVKLSWRVENTGVCNIYRAKGETGEFQLLEPKTYAENYLDTTAESGITYRYKVTTYIEGSNEASETEGLVITVKVADKEIVMPADQSLKCDTTQKVAIQFKNFDAAPEGNWISSNKEAITVDSEGNVTSHKPGFSTITFTTLDDYSKSCAILVIGSEVYPASNLYTSREWQVFTITNKNRMKEGRLPLSMPPLLKKAADIRKKELQVSYGHVRPNGTSWSTSLSEVGYSSSFVSYGENIANRYTTPAQVMKAWMNSTGHYSNIMNSDYMHFASGENSNYWVQLFSGCKSEKFDGIVVLPLTEGSTFRKGTSIEDFGTIIAVSCKIHGISYMPLISEMCTGYNSQYEAEQTITVKYGTRYTTFDVTVKGGSAGGGSGSGGSSGGGSGSGGSSGGGSSSGGSSGGGPSGGSGTGGGPGTVASGQNDSTGEWKHDGTGWWYEYASGGYAKQWQSINDRWFLFNEFGYMLTGWQNINNIWYNLNLDGSMATNWIQNEGKWYYLFANGSMATGWQQLNNKWYYLSPKNGECLMNTITPDGYSVDATGALIN